MHSRREILGLLSVLPLACQRAREAPVLRAVKVGLLTSQQGDMSADESGVRRALQFAIAQVNAKHAVEGGLHLEVLEADGKSDSAEFAKQAEILLDQGAQTLFGCWTSASRKAVLPVLEKKNGFLVYPVQYEGLEQHPNVLYIGSTPNQQILPAVRWATETLKRSRFFLVGSDYVFPRMANAMIQDQLAAMGMAPVGTSHAFPVDKASTSDAQRMKEIAESIVDQIVASKADAVLSTVNGTSGNEAFFRALQARALKAREFPVLSFSVPSFRTYLEAGINVEGHYAVWGYLDDPKNAKNQQLRRDFSAHHGLKNVRGELLNDPMVAAWAGVHLWAQAARELPDVSGELPLDKLREALKGQSVHCPSGVLTVDPVNQHVWRRAIVGRADARGHLVQEWATPQAIHPEPYPSYRTEAAWKALLAADEAPT